MKKERLEEILAGIRGKTALVIGDFCLDGYWHADMERSRLSLETPRFPRPVTKERYSPGAGGNVAWNLKELGFQVIGLSVLGDDWRAGLLKEALAQRGISTEFFYSSPDWDRVTPAYIKPIISSSESSQEDARLDFRNYEPPSERIIERVSSDLEGALSRAEVVVIEDQLKDGLISSSTLRERLNRAAGRVEATFLVDSRYRIEQFKRMIAKPNIAELRRSFPEAGEDRDFDPALRRLCRVLAGPVYVTAGERGAYLLSSPQAEIEEIPTIGLSPPVDITGAGDSFMAGLAAALAGGSSLKEGGLIANMAASVSVKKLNVTGTASGEEILSRYEDFRELIGSSD